MQLVAADLGLSKENPARRAPAFPRRIPWAILLLAAFFRIAWLDIKPAHFDEGINGWFVDQITKTGFYKYDPTNYHGPLHFYVEFLSLTMFGRNLWALRMPVVLAGLLTVWMAWAFRRHFGNRAAAIAAAGLAISPAFVFFERYAIHETWLVLFLMLLIWGVLEMISFGTKRGLQALMLGITGCILTKETYALHFTALGLAFGACWIWQRVVPVQPAWRRVRQCWTQDELWKYLTFALLALVFFYSGNFFDWKGLQGLFTTFSTWAHTGAESAGHAKKDQQFGSLNYYWLWLGWKFEPLMLVGAAASLAAIWKVTGPMRLLALYAWATLCAYSLITYKTPWCVISIAWAFYLMVGVAIDWLLRLRWRAPVILLTIATFGFSIVRMVELNFQKFDDDHLPYVYVQTYRDVNLVLDPIRSLLRREPSQIKMQGRVHLDSYYPLPWYLGDLDHAYFPKPGVYSENEDADFLLCDEKKLDEMRSHLKEAYYEVRFRLRSGQGRCVALFNADVFGREFNDREPELPAKDEPEAEAADLADPE